MTLSQVNRRIQLIFALYKRINQEITCINAIDKKQVSKLMFPHIVSKFVVYKLLRQQGIPVTQHDTAGDLGEEIDGQYQPVSVKCVASAAPVSFGPHKPWVKLYILDCHSPPGDQYRLLCIPLAYSTPLWKNIKVVDQITFDNVISSGRRVQILLPQLLQQVPHSVVSTGCLWRVLTDDFRE